jgi:hypothetical protein
MAGWTKMTAFAGKGQQILMAAVLASPIRSRTSLTRAKPLLILAETVAKTTV